MNNWSAETLAQKLKDNPHLKLSKSRVVALGISEPMKAALVQAQKRNAKRLKKWNYEQKLADQLRAVGVTDFELEGKWLEGRKYRADLLFRKQRLIVEIEGAAHRIKSRFHSDIRKGQDAMLAGWRLLRVSTGQVRDGSACKLVCKVLEVMA